MKDDMIGKRFGRLVVVSKEPSRGDNKVRYLCKCDCGVIGPKQKFYLTSGHTKSCGCLKVDVSREKATTHGRAGIKQKDPTYSSWSSMKRRCLNKNRDNYQHYGGRGIAVCERWLESFENFLTDMGERPKGMTLDRIDNDGNYEPGNCQWSNIKHQTRNRRSNRLIEYGRVTKTVTDWAECFGLKPNVVLRRLHRGWSVEKALETPCLDTKRNGT